MEQPRIERVLRLMHLMSGNVYYTIDELADKLETSYRSIYRYIDTFKTVGFTVEKINGNIYRLVKMPSQAKDLSKLIYFSEEEGRLICFLIENLDSTNTLKATLYKKLAAIYDLTSINEFTGSKSNATTIENLRNAIDTKKKVLLKNYASANSGDVRDRLVEPYGFTNNHLDVWVYDLEKKQNRIYKIPRIESVEILPEDWEFESLHKRGLTDAFRMQSDHQTHVRLELSMRARNLLVEEFPLAEPDIHEEDGRWFFDGMVSAMEGVGRFCIGLVRDVKVIESDELKQYISDYVKGQF